MDEKRIAEAEKILEKAYRDAKRAEVKMMMESHERWKAAHPRPKHSEKKERDTMTFAVYVDGEGYIGDVSAPTREAAAEFLAGQGFKIGTFELRETAE